MGPFFELPTESSSEEFEFQLESDSNSEVHVMGKNTFSNEGPRGPPSKRAPMGPFFELPNARVASSESEESLVIFGGGGPRGPSNYLYLEQYIK